MIKFRYGVIMLLYFLLLGGCSGAKGDGMLDWIPAEVTPVTEAEKDAPVTDEAPQPGADEEDINEKIYSVAEDVLVIGNSITLGFGTHGMASSAVDTDYYYLLHQYLLNLNPELQMKRIAGYGWESSVTTEERLAFLEETVHPEVSEECDLIIIQLGDNVNTSEKQATFATDADKLLEWVKKERPEARVLWVFGRYNLSNATAIQAACKKHDAEYVDISIVSSDDKYKARINDKYEKADGTTGIIDDPGVASHPNDEGMRVIYELIANQLNYKEEE